MAHPALIDDFIEELMQGIREGKTLHAILAGTGLTVDNFYRRLKHNPELQARYAEVRQEAVQTRADKADYKADQWVEDDDCPAPIKLAWLKRHQPAFRDKMEISGTLERTDTLENATLDELRRMLSEAKGEPQVEIEAGDQSGSD